MESRRAGTARATIGADGLARFFTAVGLVVVFPWLVISHSPDGGRNAVWILCLVLTAWSGLRLALLIGAGVPRLFEFSFWLYCYLFLGLAAAAQIHGDALPGTTANVSPDLDLATVGVIALGIVAFDVGRVIWRSRRHVEAIEPHADTSEAALTSSVARSLWLLAVVTPIAVLFIAIIGPATFFTSRFEFSEVSSAKFDETVLPLLRAISWVPALVVLHRIISRRLARPGSRLTGPEQLGVVVASVLLLFANNPLTSSRYAFGSMALSLAVLLGACATTKRARRTMLVIVVGFVVVFPLADTFRRQETGEVELSVLDEYSGNPDYDSYAQISNTLQVVADDGPTYLRQPLGVVLFWVPRSIWEDKPIDTGVYLAQERGYDFENLSAPLWSELYTIGGPVTVFAGFVGLGFVVAMADRRLLQGLRGERSYWVAGAFMPFYLIILLRGSLLQAAALAAVFAASVWLTRPIVVGQPLRRAAKRPAASSDIVAFDVDGVAAGVGHPRTGPGG